MKQKIAPDKPEVSVFFLCMVLFVFTALLFSQVTGFDFINFDDNDYVYANAHVKSGISKASVIWAFTAFHASNWHPLTWLSHMIDCQLFGLNPGPHHMTNLLFHSLNVILLFLFLFRTTGFKYRSFFIASLFACHPMHVESVVWISERKDVLSTFFFFLVLLSYVSWKKSRKPKDYIQTVCLFACGLMAKPMLVTVPFILLLVDYWPLSRIKLHHEAPENETTRKESITTILYEKFPFILLSGISCTLTMIAQKKGGALLSLKSLPAISRITNAFISYVKYIYMAIFPTGLSVLYPHPGKSVPWVSFFSAIAVLGFIFILALRNTNKRPWFVFGCLFYFVTLLPVIGFVQVGYQSMADRYSYIPFTGLFIILSWGGAELLHKLPSYKTLTPAIAVVICAFYSNLTWEQIKLWENSITLFNRAVTVTGNNEIAHNNLGIALFDAGRTEEAILHYKKSIEIFPYLPRTYINLGVALAKSGDENGAIAQYRAALKLSPDSAAANYNMGVVFENLGNMPEAIRYFMEVIRLEPDHDISHLKLAGLYEKNGNISEAKKHYEIAASLTPGNEKIYNKLGIISGKEKHLDEAVNYFSKALEISPLFEDAHENLALAFRKLGKYDLAIRHYEMVLQINPESETAKNNLYTTYRIKKQIKGINTSIEKLQKELKADSENFSIYRKLGYLNGLKENFDEAVRYYEKANAIKPHDLSNLQDLAFVYLMKDDDAHALHYLKQIEALQPDNRDILYRIASLSARQNQVEEAINYLEKLKKNGFKNFEKLKTDQSFTDILNHPDIRQFLENQNESAEKSQ